MSEQGTEDREPHGEVSVITWFLVEIELYPLLFNSEIFLCILPLNIIQYMLNQNNIIVSFHFSFFSFFNVHKTWHVQS